MFEKLKKWWTLDMESERKTNDSVHETVPQSKRHKTLPLLVLGFTWGFLVTGLLIGGVIGPNMAFYTGTIPAILIGTFILFLIGAATGLVGYKIGGTNDMAFRYAYGKAGRILPAIFIFIVIIGFQGITIGGTAIFWLKGSDHPAFFWVAIGIGILFTTTTYIGIKAIEKFANPSIIVLVIVSIYAIIYNITKIGGWNAFNEQTITMSQSTDGGPMSLAMGVNLVIGSWIAGAVLASEFTRFAKNKWAAIGLVFANFFVAQVLLLTLGAVGAVVSGTFDFTQYLYGVAPVIGGIALLTMTLAMWTTANTNLYLPSSQVASIFKRPFKVAVVFCGTLGTLLAAFGFFQTFQSFILLIGTVIPPIAGPMIADFWIVHRTKYEAKYLNKLPMINMPAIIAAVAGIIITFMATGIPMMGIEPAGFLVGPWIVPAILGVIVSMVVYLITYYIFKLMGITTGYAKAISENEDLEIQDLEIQDLEIQRKEVTN